MVFASPFEVNSTGVLRHSPDDFIVEEIPLFQPSGEGEHLWLKIRKTSSNTDWVAAQLAKLFGVKRNDVGFAGLKDRHAITTQWFSVYLPGKEAPDLSTCLPDSLASSIHILQQTRHLKKLRRGTLKGNQFTIIVRHFSGDPSLVKKNIADINQHGIPNYYGNQRFGHKFSNINSATEWFNGENRPKTRHLRSLYLSAARAWIFNHILSERVTGNIWDKAISGDVMMLNGTHSWFIDTIDEQLSQRVKQLDIHPSGALWGKGTLASQQEVANLETKVAQQHPVLCQGLEKHGLKQERRALRIKVTNLESVWLDHTSLQLSFSLPPGAYATVLVEQLVNVETVCR